MSKIDPEFEKRKETFMNQCLAYRPYIHSIAGKIVANPDRADDITQRVFVRVCEWWIATYGEAKPADRERPLVWNLKAFLGQVARREAINDLTRTGPKDSFDETQPYDDISCPEIDAIRAEIGKRLRQALAAACPDPEDQLMFMKVIEGETGKDIEHALGKSEGTVRSRLFRCRRRVLVHMVLNDPELLDGPGGIAEAITGAAEDRVSLTVAEGEALLRVYVRLVAIQMAQTGARTEPECRSLLATCLPGIAHLVGAAMPLPVSLQDRFFAAFIQAVASVVQSDVALSQPLQDVLFDAYTRVAYAGHLTPTVRKALWDAYMRERASKKWPKVFGASKKPYRVEDLTNACWKLKDYLCRSLEA